MTRFLILAAFLSSIANAQDVPPPPKPPDDGPSLEVTMKFIQDKLAQIGRVNYIVYKRDSKNGRDWMEKTISEISSLRARADTCRITYHWFFSVDGVTEVDADTGIPLTEVELVTVSSHSKA